jgi:hypothetical protein
MYAVDFARCLSTGEFCSFFVLGWPQYREEVAEPLGQLHRLSKILGFNFEGFATTRRFSDVISRPWKLVILLTHFNEEVRSLEFADGMFDVESVVQCFPKSANFILDCVACQTKGIAREIKSKIPTLLVTEFEMDLTATPWIIYYSALIKFIISKRASYFGAHLAARSYMETLNEGSSRS